MKFDERGATFCANPLSLHPADRLPLSRLHTFTIWDMGDQSGSLHFRALFESALQDYEQKTTVSLAKHPLAEKFQNIHSAETVVSLLQSEARTFVEFRGRDKVMRSIKNTVLILCKLSAIPTFGDAVGLVRQKVLIGFPYL